MENSIFNCEKRIKDLEHQLARQKDIADLYRKRCLELEKDIMKLNTKLNECKDMITQYRSVDSNIDDGR